MESIEMNMAAMMDSFHKRMTDFEVQMVELKTPNAAPTVGSLLTDFSSFKEFTLQALTTLQNQVALLVSSIDNFEMKGRRKMLMFHGVPEAKQEDTANLVINVVHEKLNIENFTINNIKRCHRMGTLRSGGSPRPVLVKIEDIAVRDKIWFAKTKLKGSGITMSEFLTKVRHNIFMAARSKFGVSKCWTREGSVYVSGSNNTRHCISSLEDINKLQVHNKPKDSNTLAQDMHKPAANAEKSTKPKRAAAIKK